MRVSIQLLAAIQINQLIDCISHEETNKFELTTSETHFGSDHYQRLSCPAA